MKKQMILPLLIILFLDVSAQKFDKLAQTPPMGWNSWNKFGPEVSEKLIISIADAMAKNGMTEAGYEYIVLDDYWQVSRDENGNILADKDRFPNGMKYLADYIHSKGLKFGIYSCAGTQTCGGRPGSRGYEFQDARTYAQWGVDYIKYDWCYTTTQDAQASYEIMRDALYKAGRPIVLSVCEHGNHKPWEWGKDVGHLWRTTIDIVDRWDAMMYNFDMQRNLADYAGPGHWNDPDMLEVGNGGMTTDEYKTHFSLWCMLAAPLIAGNDVREMTPEIKGILTNNEVIDVNQDKLGKQGFCYRDNGDFEIWVKELTNNEKAVCLLNRSDEIKNVQVDYAFLLCVNNSYWSSDPYKLEDYKVRDLWEHNDIKLKTNISSLRIPPHSVKMYRFIKK
ncbi:MAG: glycoside hydrolase family 27 protein [Bacteroidales bacterium]|nr:glycoside hydrolase family 27 protein [Bacteroidales bacterium]